MDSLIDPGEYAAVSECTCLNQASLGLIPPTSLEASVRFLNDVAQYGNLRLFDHAEAEALDALVCSGYKWLSAPGGVALLAVAGDLAAAIPAMVGWKGSPAPFDFRPQQLSLAAGARRFELSTMSYSAAAGLLASIKPLAGIGLRSLHEHASRLAADLAEQTAPLGWTPYRALGDRSASGHIVSLRHPAAVAEEVQAALAREHRIHTSSRGGGIRVSLHAYNCGDDVQALADALASIGLR